MDAEKKKERSKANNNPILTVTPFIIFSTLVASG